MKRDFVILFFVIFFVANASAASWTDGGFDISTSGEVFSDTWDPYTSSRYLVVADGEDIEISVNRNSNMRDVNGDLDSNGETWYHVGLLDIDPLQMWDESAPYTHNGKSSIYSSAFSTGSINSPTPVQIWNVHDMKVWGTTAWQLGASNGIEIWLIPESMQNQIGNVAPSRYTNGNIPGGRLVNAPDGIWPAIYYDEADLARLNSQIDSLSNEVRGTGLRPYLETRQVYYYNDLSEAAVANAMIGWRQNSQPHLDEARDQLLALFAKPVFGQEISGWHRARVNPSSDLLNPYGDSIIGRDLVFSNAIIATSILGPNMADELSDSELDAINAHLYGFGINDIYSSFNDENYYVANGGINLHFYPISVISGWNWDVDEAKMVSFSLEAGNDNSNNLTQNECTFMFNDYCGLPEICYGTRGCFDGNAYQFTESYLHVGNSQSAAIFVRMAEFYNEDVRNYGKDIGPNGISAMYEWVIQAEDLDDPSLHSITGISQLLFNDWEPNMDSGNLMECLDLSGIACSSGQACVGGDFRLSSDFGNLCCVGGTCGDSSCGDSFCDFASGENYANCPSDCLASPDNSYFVRFGASGDFSGRDWDNAFASLPESLERGYTYYVADGSYDGYHFDDSGVGNIVIRKATGDSHGSDVGWDFSYGDGEATFGSIEFDSNDIVFDGVTKYGFHVIGDFQSSAVRIDSDNVVINNTDIDGGFVLNGGVHVDGACNALDIRGSNVLIQNCDIRNVADDGVGVYGDYISLIDNKIHALHGCGTDGGCGPCYNGHSDGLELQDTSNVLLDGNIVYDVASTSALITGQWSPGMYTRNLEMYNNIFYTPETGISAYFYYIQGAKIYNNIFWGRTQGTRYGGVAFGPEVTDMDFRNNVLLNINFAHLGGVFDSSNHRFSNNLFAMINEGEYNLGLNEFVGDPGFLNVVESSDIGEHLTDVDFNDFMISSDSDLIDAGILDSNAPTVDIFNKLRDSSPDIGPIEYSDNVVSCSHEADLECDGVDFGDLVIYIERWKRGEVELLDLARAVELFAS